MANYVYIVDGKIQEYHDVLPNSWKNTSGFNLMVNNLPALKTYGWYPVIRKNIDIDIEKEYTNGYQYVIGSDSVTETPIVVQYTELELASRNAYKKEEFWNNLRIERDRKLSESDWSQLPDIQAMRDEEWKRSWKEYRQQLRDLPGAYQNTTTYNLGLVEWPTQPEK